MSDLKIIILLKSQLFRNSFWGVSANIVQTLFVAFFFIILARRYTANEFAQFLIATTIYQLITSFSSLGLGQWFIRQYESETEKEIFTAKFLRTQLKLGLLFYGVNILLAYLIYPDSLIRILCLILGINIIFDNFINAIRSLNIAELKQKTTAVVLIADGFMKLLIGLLLFITPLSLLTLAGLTIVARGLTVIIFMVNARSRLFSLQLFRFAVLLRGDLKRLVLNNWQFIVIGSISIIYWRVGNIIISKMLTLNDVASYEIAYRFFSTLQILPVAASATIYPRFVQYFNAGDREGLKRLYRLIFAGYSVLAVVLYFFFYSFSEQLVPFLFGNNYPGAAECLRQMFLTFLLMPTVLLQANLIVAMGLESRDMWFNITSLLMYIIACFIGLHYYPSLWVVNYSIFGSFIVFHLLQDVLLIRRNVVSFNHCTMFYSAMLILVISYHYWFSYANPYILFITYSGGILVSSFLLIVYNKSFSGIFKGKVDYNYNQQIL